MDNMTPEVLAEARARLHDLMLGFSRTESVAMQELAAGRWALAAQIEQLRRQPLVRAFDDELLAAVAVRAIDPSVEARYLTARLREVEADARAEAAQSAVPTLAAAASTHVPRRADLPPTVIDMMERTVALIARKQLGFPVLHARNSDSLDFRDCSVWSVRDALIEAYEEGWHAAA